MSKKLVVQRTSDNDNAKQSEAKVIAAPLSVVGGNHLTQQVNIYSFGGEEKTLVETVSLANLMNRYGGIGANSEDPVKSLLDFLTFKNSYQIYELTEPGGTNGK